MVNKTMEAEHKDSFVKNKLKPLLMAADKRITNVYYGRDDDRYPHEIVTIEYKTRDGLTRSTEVNVTMDSMLYIAKDVLKAVEG